jgi:hypothetical protein
MNTFSDRKNRNAAHEHRTVHIKSSEQNNEDSLGQKDCKKLNANALSNNEIQHRTGDE